MTANLASRTRVYIASDHAGFALKQSLQKALGSDVQWIDLGPHSEERVDYPDYADKLATSLAYEPTALGVLICGSGIGMSIAANRHKGMRAAHTESVESARLAREHNNANVLCLGARLTPEPLAQEMVKTWLTARFEGGRHSGRIDKLATQSLNNDAGLSGSFIAEEKRQRLGIELIASENYVSPAVLAAQGSLLTNKYAEGYPGKRYYGGCENVDTVEQLALDRATQLFGAEAANVQPHSGSQANMAVYFSFLKPGDKIMGMNLSHGGHLTHGSPVNFSGKLFHTVFYGVSAQTGRIDYDEVRQIALRERPKAIIAGASAYTRVIDFKTFRQIADEVGAKLVVDMAHIAGLVAAGLHPSPIGIAHYVTTTTHKTLRGPRGGLILCAKEDLKTINSQIFPGIQGGPLMHVIAAKAVAFGEALQPSFKAYCERIVENAQALAAGLTERGYSLVSGGTDNHLVLVDLTNKGLTGKVAEETLDRAGITVNKNAVPFDKQSPFVTSGIRIGVPAVTTRGLGKKHMAQIVAWIDRALQQHENESALQAIHGEVQEFMKDFPLFRP